MSLEVRIAPHSNDRKRAHTELKSVKNEEGDNAASSAASRPKHAIPIDFHG
jgi:hypothetical protein